MRLSISLLGTEVLAIEFGHPAAEDEWIDTGATTSYAVGFTRPEIPEDIAFRQYELDGPGEDV
jgi:hypothetical protein